MQWETSNAMEDINKKGNKPEKDKFKRFIRNEYWGIFCTIFWFHEKLFASQSKFKNTFLGEGFFWIQTS